MKDNPKNLKQLKQLKQSDIKPLREKIYKEQGEKCLICGQTIPDGKRMLDHQHKLFRNQELGKDGAGLVRGVLCSACNCFEGKIFFAHRRLGIHKKDKSLADILRGLADYLDRENLSFIHPSELPKKPKLKKSSYNQLCKILRGTYKIPVYTKNYTQQLKKLYLKANLKPQFYGE